MDEVEKPRKRRRAVGPPGARPPGEEPRPEAREEPAGPDDDQRFLVERPPHHGDV
jgi:hypothetical protein